MKRWLHFILVLFLCAKTLSQTDSLKNDSLVSYQDLVFTSGLEKNSFSYKEPISEMEYLNLALTANTEKPSEFVKDYIDTYNSFARDLNTTEFKKLKTDKQIKLLYKKVHSYFFKKYNLNTNFESIFKNGDYNCVTATTLYALLLYHFNIPFQIKETATHVFIVALPESKSILLESTDPKIGFFEYNQAFKEKFVDYLVAEKLVSSKEVADQGIELVFNKNYFTQQSINLSQLIGLMYYNNAVSKIESGDFKSASDQLLKSYYLYPCEKSKYLIYQSIINCLANADYQNQSDWHLYVLISKFLGSTITTEIMKSEFSRIDKTLLVDKSDVKKFTEAYNYIDDQIKDSVLKSEISFIYNFEMARYLLVTKKESEALPFIEEAYQLHPNNYEIENIFISSLMNNFLKTENIAELEKIENYSVKYVNLLKNEQFTTMLLYYYLAQAKDFLNVWNIAKAETMFQKFENTYDINKTVSLNTGQVAEIYAQAAAGYYKKNNVKKAREYVLRGLKYAPDSYQLKNSLKMLN
jgi:hypothetical protein